MCQLQMNLQLMKVTGGRWILTGFVYLMTLAQKILAPPPTIVPSERLFSTAGDVRDIDFLEVLHPPTAHMTLSNCKCCMLILIVTEDLFDSFSHLLIFWTCYFWIYHLMLTTVWYKCSSSHNDSFWLCFPLTFCIFSQIRLRPWPDLSS